MSEPRWSVVCTADEPLPLLLAFATHHLALGAAEVHLYLDKPRPGHAEALAGIEGLIVTACDDSYWQGRRKRTIENRQQHNALDAYHKTASGWICHIDSDEFLSGADELSVGSVLAAQPAEVDYLVLPMRERIYRAGHPVRHLFDGATVAPYSLRREVAAPTPALRRRGRFSAWGLVGHAQGKSFLRTGLPLVVGIHRPRPSLAHPHRDRGRDAFRAERTSALHLVHFDGLTPFHWAAKLWRMARLMSEDRLAIQGPGRQRLIRRTRGWLPDIAPLHALERALRHLDGDSLAALQAAGALHDMPPIPADTATARGLLPRESFHPEAFDREMARMYPETAPLLDAWQALDSRAA